jgi:hypothetical protein
MSWNPVFVNQQEDEMILQVVEFINKNRSLIHLDLSYTEMSETQMKSII